MNKYKGQINNFSIQYSYLRVNRISSVYAFYFHFLSKADLVQPPPFHVSLIDGLVSHWCESKQALLFNVVQLQAHMPLSIGKFLLENSKTKDSLLK